MARNPLKKNTDEPIESDAPGVPSAPAKSRIAIASKIGNGLNYWNFEGLDRFPSPYNTDWAGNSVPSDIAEQMLLHPKIYQSVNNLINGILGDGGRWIPAVSPYGSDKEQFPEARKYADFLNWELRRMRGYSKLRQMLSCVYRGNKVAPLTWADQETGKWKGRRYLADMQVWPNGIYHFRRDEFGRTVMLDVLPQTNNRKTFPREKFMVLTFRPSNENPYGTKVLDPAYEAYYKDIQTDYEEMAYLSIYGGGGSIFINAAPVPDGEEEQLIPLFDSEGVPIYEADPETGIVGQAYGSQVRQNQILLQNFKTRSVYSFEHETQITLMEAQNGGAEMFRIMRDQNHKQMAAAIYGTHQLTESDRNVSSQNAEVGEGVAGLNVTEGKKMLEEEMEFVARQTIEMNFGKAALDLLPICDFGSGQNGRMPKMLNAVLGFVNSGAWTKGMMWDYNANNGLPLNYPDDEAAVMRVTGIGPNDPGGADKTSQGGGNNNSDNGGSD